MTTSPPEVICVLAAQRTGSNLLIGMLPADRFEYLGEVFNRRHLREQPFRDAGLDVDQVHELRFSDPARFLDESARTVARSGGRHSVCKVQYANVIDAQGEPTSVAAALNRSPDLPIIHLVRENLVERYVSQQVARTTGQYLLRDTSARVEPGPIVVDPQHCLGALRWTRGRMRRAQRQLARDRFVRVSYEELVADPEQVADRISVALGIPVTFRPPTTVKQGRPLREAVQNFDELQAALAGTRFAKYVSESPSGALERREPGAGA